MEEALIQVYEFSQEDEAEWEHRKETRKQQEQREKTKHYFRGMY